MRRPYECVLFDLDGTLIDTAMDLACALNATLEAHNKPNLPFARIRPTVSLGAAAMLKLAFAIDASSTEFTAIREQFLAFYAGHIAVHSQLFPEIDIVLENLEANGIDWGIVTNKPGWLTAPLLLQLALNQRTQCVVSGDTLTVRKPDPAPLLHACDILKCDPSRSLYIGDAERDIQAGKSAGMKTLVAAYGYLGEADKPASWGADGIIDGPIQLLDWLDHCR